MNFLIHVHVIISKGLGSPTRCWKLLLLSEDADVKCVYAARCGEEGATARAGQGAPLPAHCLTGALIPAKTLSRRHFVHKVRSACARMQLDEYVCLCLIGVAQIGTCIFKSNLTRMHNLLASFKFL